MWRRSKPATSCRRGRQGFTLIEVAVATAVIGMGVAAMLTAIGSGTRANDAGQKLTQAAFLAQEIREWTVRQPFANLATVTYNPPVDGRGQQITDMPGWSQAVTVSWRNTSSLSTVVTPGTSDVVYVQVVVSYNNQPSLTTGWLIKRPSP